MQAGLKKEEESQPSKVKIGEIVRFQEEDVPWNNRPGGLTGIVTEIYHEGNDILVLLSDGRLFIDRVEAFVVL